MPALRGETGKGRGKRRASNGPPSRRGRDKLQADPIKHAVIKEGGGGGVIVGMGVDITEVNRIQVAIERHGEPFLRRVYTAREREYCEGFKNKYERYAGRFAAKEAAMKALGTGWRRGVRWIDFEVVREVSGRPTIQLDGEARKIADELGVKRIVLSITHTGEQALAQVIFES